MISRVRGVPKLLNYTQTQLKKGNYFLGAQIEHHFQQVTKITRCFSTGIDPNIEQQILKAKQEAKQMLHSQQAAATEGRLTNEQILQRVMEIKSQEELMGIINSSPKPFILFCLAKHCNVSKQMLPKILDALSTQYQLWDLAIFDIDASEQLTTMLKIAKTPTILLIYGGTVVDGLVPDDQLTRLFASAQLTARNHMKSVQLQRHLQDLTGHLEKKDHQGALQMLLSI